MTTPTGSPLPPLAVLLEDNHLIGVNKPAGLLVQGDKTGDETLLERTREYVRIKYNKPGNVYLGLLHRLDRPVSGAVLFARTSKGASRISAQIREHAVHKLYRTVVLGHPPAPHGTWRDWLVPGREKRRSRIVSGPGKNAKEALLHYRLLRQTEKLAELEIELETGRKHQIRAQLAHRRLTIVGDLKYGAPTTLDRGQAIALHAYRLEARHPTRDEAVVLEAPLPAYWPLAEALL